MPDPSASMIVEKYAGEPAANVAKLEGIPIATVWEARVALGLDPDDGTATSFDVFMRENRAPFL